jgi:Amt family ammonium transporter
MQGVAEPMVIVLSLLMLPFMTTAATIPIATLGDRWRWKRFVLYGCWIALPYSLFANWVWGGGWLAGAGINWQLGHGAVDFAGSSVVFGLGGLIALAGCRLRNYRVAGFQETSPLASSDHRTAVSLGTLTLLSSLIATMDAAKTPLNALLAITASGLGSALVLKLRGRAIDMPAISQGLLAGLVAITGAYVFVDGVAAGMIGFAAGILCQAGIAWFARAGINDPLGAVSVFGAGGIWGTIAVGLFANGTSGDGWNGVSRPAFTEAYGSDGVRGLFYGDPSQLLAQLLTASVLIVFSLAMASVWFVFCNWIDPLRANEEPQLSETVA